MSKKLIVPIPELSIELASTQRLHSVIEQNHKAWVNSIYQPQNEEQQFDVHYAIVFYCHLRPTAN